MTRITQMSKRIHESIFMLNLVYPRSSRFSHGLS